MNINDSKEKFIFVGTGVNGPSVLQISLNFVYKFMRLLQGKLLYDVRLKNEAEMNHYYQY